MEHQLPTFRGEAISYRNQNGKKAFEGKGPNDVRPDKHT